MVSVAENTMMGNISLNKSLPYSLKNKTDILPVLVFFFKRRNNIELEETGGGGGAEGDVRGVEPSAASLVTPGRGDPRGVSTVNTWLSCSYPQSHRAGCAGDRAQRRGMLRVYGVRREKFSSRTNSHVIDVLKVGRRGDQTGVMMRACIREAWLSTQQKEEKW